MHTNLHRLLVLKAIITGCIFSCLSSRSFVMAAAATSEPVGFTTVPLLASSDTYLTVPFLRPAAYIGQISSVAGNVVTVSGTPGWASGQFVYSGGGQPNTYFILIGSGPLEGRFFTIIANAATTLTLDLEGEALAGVAAGDVIKIVPYWTLGTLFPAANAGVSFTPTTVVTSLQTTLSLFLPPAGGVNGAPASTFFFFSGAWRQTGQSITVSKDDQIVPIASPIKVRNAANAGSFRSAGAVVMQKLALPLATAVTSQQDNVVALCRPLAVSLNDAGLVASGAFTASANALLRADILMVTSNTAAGINKPPADYYIYHNSGWRKLGQPITADFGTEMVFDSSKSVTIRKALSLDGARRYWINTATY